VTDARDEYTAKAQAEHYKDDLNQLEYAISHDLTEPIRSISVGLSFYEAEFMKDQPKEAVDVIHASQVAAQQLNRFVQDFMSYLKITEGKRRVSVRTVDLNQLLQDITMSLRIIIQEADAEIVFNNLPSVTGEGRMLFQVFSNLITNAVKFRDPSRKCRVEITCVPDGDNWLIQVKDNGLGIHPSKVSRIFTPFIRVHKNIPGSGIGLAVVKRCVELQGGQVSVDSTVGAGTTFSVWLLRDRGSRAHP
jgi:signal transduction histidine kinase